MSSRTASFEFGSPRPNAQFQCRLDGGDFKSCASPQQFGNLPEGTHTFEVRAFDQYGNIDGSPALYTWTVDVTAPGPRIAAAGGSTPSVRGTAGTSAGDDGSVTVDLYSGSAATGSPAQSVVVARDGVGRVRRAFDRVGGGTYTVGRAPARRRRQHRLERAGQLHGRAGGRGGRPTSRPSRSTSRSRDAAAGRVTALSSCEAACSRTVSLTTSARTATRLRPAAQGQPAGAPRLRQPGRRRRRRREGAHVAQGAPRAQAEQRREGHVRDRLRRRLAQARDRPAAGAERVAGREARAEAGRHLLGAVHDERAPRRERHDRPPARNPLRAAAA